MSGQPEDRDAEVSDRVQRDAAAAKMLLSGALLGELTRRVLDYENSIDWHTNCTSCARTLDHAAEEMFRREAAEAKLAEVRDACRSIPSPIAQRILAIIGGEENGHDDGRPAAPSELCGCRCKNPKGKCGCCDESLNDWYAAKDDEDDPDA